MILIKIVSPRDPAAFHHFAIALFSSSTNNKTSFGPGCADCCLSDLSSRLASRGAQTVVKSTKLTFMMAAVSSIPEDSLSSHHESPFSRAVLLLYPFAHLHRAHYDRGRYVPFYEADPRSFHWQAPSSSSSSSSSSTS